VRNVCAHLIEFREPSYDEGAAMLLKQRVVGFLDNIG
jgi:hypothetical protein